MDFSKKLKLLLTIFNISSRKLANAVHIDTSSISRWLNGKRIPSPNSPIIDKIVDYFINLDAFEFQRNKFYHLLAPDTNLIDPENLPRLLREWLFSPVDPGFVTNQPLSGKMKPNDSQINRLLNNIGKYSLNEKTNTSEITLQSGSKKETDVFYGDEGIKQALYNLGSELLESSEPTELIITSQDNFFWYNSKEFMSVWIGLIKRILQKGHKVKVLYNLTHGFPEVTQLIIGWLPLFATGRFEAYYYPGYTENAINFTIASATGVGAVYSSLSQDESRFGCTFLYRDYGISEYFKKKLDKLLVTAKPLITVFSSRNTFALHEELRNIEASHGCRFVCKNGLTSLTIPLPLFKKLLDKSSMSDVEKNKRYEMQKLRMETLRANSNISSYMDICFSDSLESMMNPDGYEYYPLDVFSSGNLKAEPCDALEHLKNTVEMLNTLDNFEIALVPRYDYFGGNTIYWAVKEDAGVLISTWDAQGKPVCILITETTVVNEFERYFENAWNRIPQNNRDKAWVIRKLQSKIRRLEKRLQEQTPPKEDISIIPYQY